MQRVHFDCTVTMQELYSKMNTFPFAMVLTDANGFIKECNDLMLLATGVEKEFVKGAYFDQVLMIDEPKQPFEELFPIRTEPSVINYRASIKNKDKTVTPSELCYIRGKLNDGESVCLLMLPDITSERSINLVERFAGTIISDINIGVMVIDKHFNLVEINELACRMMGVQRREVLNRNIDEAFPGVPSEYRIVQKALSEGVVVRNYAHAWNTEEQRFELLVDSNVIKNEYGEVVGAYTIFKDVTNLRSLEQQIQRSDRLAMIGQIAAGTAHEIRNPLTSIKGFLQVLKQSLGEKGMSKEEGFTEIMLKEIDRINELVSEFLLLSKPRDIQYQAVNIGNVFKDLLPIIHNEAILYDVELRCSPQFELPSVIADSELLKQVFLNICKNGIEAMSEGGILTINHRLIEKEKQVCIDIHDTGPGIPPYVIDKIFDPFYTTKENGTGLGLPVCQKIVHDMGGMIRVASKGFGTTFSVILPFQ